MKNLFEKSIVELGNLPKKPSNKEWNKIAKQKTLMSYTSLKSYSKMDFISLYRYARQYVKDSLFLKSINKK